MNGDKQMKHKTEATIKFLDLCGSEKDIWKIPKDILFENQKNQ